MEQRVDALIKKRVLMNYSEESLTFNSYCMYRLHMTNEQTMLKGHSMVMTMTKIEGKSIRKHWHRVSHECHNAEKIPSDHGGNGNPHPKP